MRLGSLVFTFARGVLLLAGVGPGCGASQVADLSKHNMSVAVASNIATELTVSTTVPLTEWYWPETFDGSLDMVDKADER